jgi:transaldolase
MVKIPATESCLAAITEVVGSGINVNVTLIFSRERYQSVLEAYFSGIELALSRQIDISQIKSVASFFISRVDSAVDELLLARGTDPALKLRSSAAVANARLAYELFQKSHRSERVETLMGKGMNLQRPLWASTGVKDPQLPDAHYVLELAAPNVVNTMPEKTLLALADVKGSPTDKISGSFDSAREVLEAIQNEGIAIDEVTQKLESEGLQKFTTSWHELIEEVELAMESLK